MGNQREMFHPDATYHIYNHAVGDEDIFKDEENYNFFLRKLNEWISPLADVFAYCLMKNHFHLLLRIKSLNELKNLMDKKLERKKILLKIRKQESQTDLKLLND